MSVEPNPHDPNDLGDLHPEEFVGEPSAGDSSPGEFMSNDQSQPEPRSGDDPEPPREAHPDDQEDS